MPIPSDIMLGLVLDALPARIFWKDRNSTFIGANQKFAEDARVRGPEDLVGKCDFDFYPPKQAEAFRADDREVMESGKAKVGIEEQLTLANGETIWLETNKLPLIDATGQVVGVLGSYRDVTERKRAAEERQSLVEELTLARDSALKANAAKTIFIANMSHELRTPLNAIIGFSDLLLEEDSDGMSREELTQDLMKIRVAAGQLLGVVDDILDLSKLSSGRVILQDDPISPPALIEEVMETLSRMADAHNVRLAWDAPPPNFWTVCDGRKLRQCLFNVISNACKFTRNGDVLVRLDRESAAGSEKFVVTVRDSGIGMNADQLRRLFLPFAQVDASIRRSFGGTGLGLAVTRSLVELMGGEISVESAVGVGSTFVLKFPLVACADQDEGPRPLRKPPCGRSTFCGVG